jgi:hypothetical protein
VNALLDLLRHDTIEFDPGAQHGERVLIIVTAGLKQDRREGDLKQLSPEYRKTLALLLADGDSAGGGDLGDHGGLVPAQVGECDIAGAVSDQRQIDLCIRIAPEIRNHLLDRFTIAPRPRVPKDNFDVLRIRHSQSERRQAAGIFFPD